MRISAVNRPDVPDIDMPSRFQTDISYFITPAGEEGVPQLGPGEYWVKLTDAQSWLEDLVIEVVSPLSAEIKAEVEINEDQERWLQWLVSHHVEHIRIEKQ